MSTTPPLTHSFFLLPITLSLATLLASPVSGQRTGEQIFNSVCIACHTIGEGGRPGLGPDLKYATYNLKIATHNARDREWLKSFIRDSQALVKAGDERAVAAFDQFNRFPMTPNPMTDDEMDSLLEYLDAAHGLFKTGATKGDPARGLKIFQGDIRLANGGAACISCHHVKNDAVIGGGLLAKDLTQAFTRLGSRAALSAIIGSQPYPVMERAYKDNPLEPGEVADAVAFLEKADAEHALQHPMDYGYMLFFSGMGGCALLFILFGLFWKGRKRHSVNSAIYDRQLASL